VNARIDIGLMVIPRYPNAAWFFDRKVNDAARQRSSQLSTKTGQLPFDECLEASLRDVLRLSIRELGVLKALR
jgi:hypothetical protein